MSTVNVKNMYCNPIRNHSKHYFYLFMVLWELLQLFEFGFHVFTQLHGHESRPCDDKDQIISI